MINKSKLHNFLNDYIDNIKDIKKEYFKTLCRAKTIKSHKWVYGYLIEDNKKDYYILTYFNNVPNLEKDDFKIYKIIPETIGYFTNQITKKEKQKVFSGDILYKESVNDIIFVIVYFNKIKSKFDIFGNIDKEYCNLKDIIDSGYEILSNIYDVYEDKIITEN